MIIEHDLNGWEWVRTFGKVNGKTVSRRVPLAQYEREQEAVRMAKEQRVAEEKAKKQRQAAEKERKQRAAKLAATTPIEATILLARRGNKKVLPMLRRALGEHPELWQHFGNLALQTQESWLQLIAGKDLLLAETMRLHLDAMRTELAGPNPSPLDRLLVDRILATHVAVLYFEAMETTDPTAENMRLARYRMDRRDQAHRQFLSAVKMLATVRSLVARTNVIQVAFCNPPMAHLPAAPIVPGANGDEPHRHNGHANGVKNRFDADVAGPINRIKKINGHNRRSKRLMPAEAGVEG
jgi:hypothetical protein